MKYKHFLYYSLVKLHVHVSVQRFVLYIYTIDNYYLYFYVHTFNSRERGKTQPWTAIPPSMKHPWIHSQLSVLRYTCTYCSRWRMHNVYLPYTQLSVLRYTCTYCSHWRMHNVYLPYTHTHTHTHTVLLIARMDIHVHVCTISLLQSVAYWNDAFAFIPMFMMPTLVNREW